MNLLSSDKPDLSLLGNVIDEARAMKSEFRMCTITHVRREANSAAHATAKRALRSRDAHLWLDSFPNDVALICLADCIDVESVVKNRFHLRGILFATPGASQYLSGVTLFGETLNEITDLRKLVVGVLPGVKAELHGTMDGTFAQDFAQRCQKFYEAGARYVEWRSVFNTGPSLD
ncbi:hypothetical protein PTKIN_Ptkin08bG0026700 [Pterospermum kingtungense]